jgi:hypothetical protein
MPWDIGSREVSPAGSRTVESEKNDLSAWMPPKWFHYFRIPRSFILTKLF